MTAWLAGGAAALLVVALVAAGCRAFAAPPWRGPRTDHFDGRHFHNESGAALHADFGSFLRWRFTRELGPWHGEPHATPGPPPPRAVTGGALRVTFVGHATVLLQMDGVNVLTDPVWSARVSPVPFAGPRRVRPPGLRFEDLPPIHAVLLSHNHYDHMDVATLRRLARDHHPRFFTALGNAAFLAAKGIGPVEELDWWGDAAAPVAGLTVTAVPAQHFSNRSVGDRDVTLWCGFVLRGAAGAVYFAGDTGFGPHFAEIRARLGAPRLALLPIGAYRPRWFMGPIHVSPEEAVMAHHALGAGTSVAVHFGTFVLADDGETEPVEDLERYLATAPAPVRPRFWVLGFGEGRDVP
jgi:L-ascorbate metabolism protein UlaG (beta-lactamase superfamily)